ncbi:hypothetical protein GJV12_04290 [Raoultella sp. RIT712]|nr:hypothetical protein [Raoultella sp. RIT712]
MAALADVDAGRVVNHSDMVDFANRLNLALISIHMSVARGWQAIMP